MPRPVWMGGRGLCVLCGFVICQISGVDQVEASYVRANQIVVWDMYVLHNKSGKHASHKILRTEIFLTRDTAVKATDVFEDVFYMCLCFVFFPFVSYQLVFLCKLFLIKV